MRKKLIIESPELRKRENGTEIAFKVTRNEVSAELTYFIESEYEKYICDDRCDAAVVALLLYVIRNGYDIECRGTVSRMLMYNLNYHLIPMICSSESSLDEVQIRAAKTTDTVYGDAKGVATGISCGIDSFYTLYEYSGADISEEYRLTHLTYFRNGAHHGQTSNSTVNLQKSIFDEQTQHVRDFCEKNGYKLILIDSNLTSFIEMIFEKISFHKVHTFHSLSFAFLLPKLIGTYYYSSAGIKENGAYTIGIDDDSAYYDRVSLPLLSTESFRAYSANRNATRLDKVKALSGYKESHDWLLVCLKGGKNCGKCLKCERTLIELDVTDNLDLYKKSFNISDYSKRKHTLVVEVCEKALLKKDVFYQDVLEYATKNNPAWLDCLTENDKGNIIYRVLLEKNKYPDSYADDIHNYCKKMVPDWEKYMGVKHRIIICLTRNKRITKSIKFVYHILKNLKK